MNDVETEQKRADLERIIGGIRLGRRYQGVTFADYFPTCEKAKEALQKCHRFAETFSDRFENGDNILLLGSPGTGKNLLAGAICNAIAQQGRSSLHTSVSKLVRRIKDSWKSKTEMEQEVIDSFITPDFLVINEIGVQFGSATEERLLFEVIDGRYEEKKPTGLISNLSFAQLEPFIGFRVMDRLCEGKGSVVEFKWESYRRRKP